MIAFTTAFAAGLRPHLTIAFLLHPSFRTDRGGTTRVRLFGTTDTDANGVAFTDANGVAVAVTDASGVADAPNENTNVSERLLFFPYVSDPFRDTCIHGT